MRQPCSIIHSENAYASGQEKRPRGPRSIGKPKRFVDETIFRSPTTDLNTQAVTFYINHYLQVLEDVQDDTIFSTTMTDYFLPIWKLKSTPILDLGVSSLGLVLFSRVKGNPQAAIEASRKYCQLLSLIRTTMLSLNEENIDACLLAIFFMGRYEDVLYHPSQPRSEHPSVMGMMSFSHHDGALAVLKYWQDHISQRYPATNVIKHSRRGVIRSALLRSCELPAWLLDGALFGEHNFELEYDHIVLKIINLRYEVRANGGKLQPGLKELNKKSHDLDHALQDWASHFPSTWDNHLQGATKGGLMLGDYPSESAMYNWSSSPYRAVWSLYYSLRILLISTRLHIINNGHESYHQQRLELRERMKHLGKDLAASIPPRIQEHKTAPGSPLAQVQIPNKSDLSQDPIPYTSTMIIWPLCIVSTLGNIDVKQRSWFKSELARLGKRIGYGNIESAETWPEI